MAEETDSWSIGDPVELNPIVIRGDDLNVWVTIPKNGPDGYSVYPYAPLLRNDLKPDIVFNQLVATDLDLALMETLLQASLDNVRAEIQRRKATGTTVHRA